MKPTFANLIEATSATTGLDKKHTRLVLMGFFKHLSDAVWAAGRVRVPGLGAFRVHTRKARRISNLGTRELMLLPSDRAVAVRVCGSWRRRG